MLESGKQFGPVSDFAQCCSALSQIARFHDFDQQQVTNETIPQFITELRAVCAIFGSAEIAAEIPSDGQPSSGLTFRTIAGLRLVQKDGEGREANILECLFHLDNTPRLETIELLREGLCGEKVLEKLQQAKFIGAQIEENLEFCNAQSPWVYLLNCLSIRRDIGNFGPVSCSQFCRQLQDWMEILENPKARLTSANIELTRLMKCDLTGEVGQSRILIVSHRMPLWVAFGLAGNYIAIEQPDGRYELLSIYDYIEGKPGRSFDTRCALESYISQSFYPGQADCWPLENAPLNLAEGTIVAGEHPPFGREAYCSGPIGAGSIFALTDHGYSNKHSDDGFALATNRAFLIDGASCFQGSSGIIEYDRSYLSTEALAKVLVESTAELQGEQTVTSASDLLNCAMRGASEKLCKLSYTDDNMPERGTCVAAGMFFLPGVVATVASGDIEIFLFERNLERVTLECSSVDRHVAETGEVYGGIGYARNMRSIHATLSQRQYHMSDKHILLAATDGLGLAPEYIASIIAKHRSLQEMGWAIRRESMKQRCTKDHVSFILYAPDCGPK